MSKKTLKLLSRERDELVSVLERMGIDVIFSRGDFRSGICTLNGERVMVVNTRLTLLQQVQILATRLNNLGADSFYIRPAQREVIERYVLN